MFAFFHQIKHFKKWIFLVASCLSLLLLTGCATPCASNRMCVAKSDIVQVDCKKDTSFKNNVCVATVEGGKETNPLWTSTVNNQGFKEALEKSLTNVDLYNSSNSARYLLTAKLNKIEQPLIGLDLTVTCKSTYQLYDQKLKKLVFEKNIVSPYTANFTSAIIAAERLKIASEGAVKENIKNLIKDLYTQS